MKLRVRKQNSDGNVRVETCGTIKEIMINEDLLHPESESIAICFRGSNSSGILELSTKEYELILQSVKKNIHLVKKL